jgi:hypothetical protein
MTVIQFTRFQADTCRLSNRRSELEAQRNRLVFELLEPEPKYHSWPTPFGWVLIGLAMISGGQR